MAIKDWMATLVSILALFISGVTMYFAQFRHVDELYAVQEGIGKVVDMSTSSIDMTTWPNSHFSFINSGNRSILIEEANLLVFQPGNDPKEDEFKAGTSSIFDRQSCSGHMQKFKIKMVPVAVKPGEIGVVFTEFWRNDEIDNIIKVIPTDENLKTNNIQFVNCFCFRIRTADGAMKIIKAPYWWAAFRRKDKSTSALVENGFEWLRGLDYKLF